MAYFYCMTALCRTQADAIRLANLLPQYASQSRASGHFCTFWVAERVGELSDDEELRTFAEADRAFYETLRKVPVPFVYAYSGVECDGWPGLERLKELLKNNQLQAGMVVEASLWREYGRSSNFVIFAPAYMWIPRDLARRHDGISARA